MEMLEEQGHQEVDSKGFLVLSETEGPAIIGEGLSGFFKPELARLVRCTCFEATQVTNGATAHPLFFPRYYSVPVAMYISSLKFHHHSHWS